MTKIQLDKKQYTKFLKKANLSKQEIDVTIEKLEGLKIWKKQKN